MSPTRRQVLATIAGGVTAASVLNTPQARATTALPDPSITATVVGAARVCGDGFREVRYDQWDLACRDGVWHVRLTPHWHDRHATLRDGQNTIVLTPEQAASVQAIFLALTMPPRPDLLNVRRHRTEDPDRHEFDLSWFNDQNARWVLLSADPTIEAAFAPMNCTVRLLEVWTKDGPSEVPYHEDTYLAQIPTEYLSGFRLSPKEILG